MNLLLKIILPVLVLMGCAFAAKKMIENKPEVGRRGFPPAVQTVEASTLKPSSYPITLDSQGTVEPSNATTLVPEIAGSVVRVSEDLVPGGRFSAGDVLVEIDKRDFEIALTQAQANLAQARAALQQEQAQAEVAEREWKSLRGDRQASALTLRLPQVAAARANVRSAAAQVERAQLDLDRATLVAPYDGIVLESSVDLGQFVNRGTAIGRIYALDAVDVRLPLANRQVSWLDLSNAPGAEKPVVTLTATIGTAEYSWTGKIERVEGFDANTQQLNVIARVENPETAADWPLRVGQYVNAQISGSVLDNVFVIPRQALRAGDEVVLVSKDSTLIRQPVEVAWGEADVVAVTSGLEAGAVLVTTPLGTVADNAPVRAIVDGVAPPPAQRGGNRRGEGQPGEGQRGEGQRREGQGGEGRPEGERNSDRT